MQDHDNKALNSEVLIEIVHSTEAIALRIIDNLMATWQNKQNPNE